MQLLGTDEERKKALELIKANLRERDRQYVTMSKNGVVSVDAKAKGGLGLSMLRDLARSNKTVQVKLGTTVTTKRGTEDLAQHGGGITVRTKTSLSRNIEVHVNPAGESSVDMVDQVERFAPGSLIMAHELFGHAFDLITRGKSSERSATTTETNLLLQLGRPQFRPIYLEDVEW